MNKYLIAVYGLILPSVTLANGADGEESIAHQMEESMPFEHFGHGHWLAGVLSIVLWISLIYTIYSLIKKFSKGPGV